MNRKGFTLIELLMVLAIIGLMSLSIFYAVAQANRGRRDNDRETAAGKVLGAASSWVADNNGVLPSSQTDANTILTQYLTGGPSSTFVDPTGNPWALSWGPGAPSGSTMVISAPASCSGTGTVIAATGGREIAVAVTLESGTNYCVSRE